MRGISCALAASDAAWRAVVMAGSLGLAGCGDWTEPPETDATGGTSSGGSGGTGGSTGGSSTGGVPACITDEAFPHPEPVEPPDGCEETSAPAFNIADHGCITASHDGDDGPLSTVRAFDDNSGTAWTANTHAPWIAYELSEGAETPVVTYKVTAAGNDDDRSADPASWELQGSNDDAGRNAELEWTTLDTQDGRIFTEPYQTQTFTLSNDVAFRHYRFLVSENAGAEKLRIAELELFPAGTPVFTIDSADQGDGDNQFSFSSNWDGHTHEPASDRYHGSTSWSDKVDETVTVVFVGSQVRLFGVLDAHHGIMGVSIDGEPETEADFYGPESAYNSLVYTSPKLCPGRHTVVGRVTGKKNPMSIGVFVSIDRAQVIP